MTWNSKGPLLSACGVDYDVAWHRAEQVYQFCKEVSLQPQLPKQWPVYYTNATIGSPLLILLL